LSRAACGRAINMFLFCSYRNLKCPPAQGSPIQPFLSSRARGGSCGALTAALVVFIMFDVA
jgi:hypothetical protein